MNSSETGLKALTPTEWLIISLAAIGFAFDIYELLMLPLIVQPALLELVGAAPGSPDFNMWVGRLFYFPAFAGGIFGLLGGWLTDRFGRRRVLTYSILLYAGSAFAAGFSTSIWMLLVLRCTTFVGVCVEFVAAVAWLAELFSNPARREKVLGYTQAFSSFGGLLVAVAYGICISNAASFPAIALPDWLNFFGGTIKDPHAAWRYTLMSGLIPAIPLILIRPFLPESPVWERKRAEGTLKRPSIFELFAPQFRQVTLVTTVMFALSYGAAFGAIQHIPRIVPGLPEIKQQVADKPVPEQRKIQQTAAANYTKVQEVGGLAGRFALAMLVVKIVSRQRLIRLFQLPGLVVIGLVFAVAAVHNRPLFQIGDSTVTLFHVGVFVAGFFTVAQFSFWGNYLPRVYPIHLRGTGESFAANIGGRMIGTCFAWLTATLAATTDMAYAPTKLAYTAAAVGVTVYILNVIASYWLPEPRKDELPD
jgi:MFS family permease